MHFPFHSLFLGVQFTLKGKRTELLEGGTSELWKIHSTLGQIDRSSKGVRPAHWLADDLGWVTISQIQDFTPTCKIHDGMPVPQLSPKSDRRFGLVTLSCWSIEMMGDKGFLLITTGVLFLVCKRLLTLMPMIATTGASPRSDEAVTIFMKRAHVINMLTRAWCRRKYCRELFRKWNMFCKVNKSPE